MQTNPKTQRKGAEPITTAKRAGQRDLARLVLYTNHTGQVSGAEISLQGILGHYDATQYRVAVACPPEGPLAAAVHARGIPHLPWAPGALGFARQIRQVGPALGRVLGAAWTLRRHIQRSHPALVHANSIRAGLFTALATLGLRVPLVVHVRDHLPPGRASWAVRVLLHWRAQWILGVSRYALTEFRVRGPGRAHYAVLHDGVDPERFDPAQTRAAGRALRTELGVSAAYPLLGVVGQLTPWKGQDDAIRALAAIRARYPDAALLVVGEAKFTGPTARYDTGRYERELRQLAHDRGVADQVRFTGERADVQAVMAALDILLVPSWAEPFGIVMIEAMAAGTPVIATTRGGPADVIRPGREGYLVPPQDPQALAQTIADLAAEPEQLRQMGHNARERIESQFTLAHQAARLAQVYARILDPGRART